MSAKVVETLSATEYSFLLHDCVADSHPRFTRQTENLPPFGAWRVLISDHSSASIFCLFHWPSLPPQSFELRDPLTIDPLCPHPFSTFRTLPTEMCSCVCLHPLPSGPVKRETEDRGAGEDKGGHQTVNPGCCSPHKKRGLE